MRKIATLIMILGMTASILGQDKVRDYGVVDLSELAGNPVRYEGKLVEVTGEVVSIKADHRRMEVFDGRGKVLIWVSLENLSEAERRALIKEPVHRVSVFGRIEMRGGRVGVVADRVLALSATLMAG